MLEGAMGRSALESIVLGAGASRVVWTDDHVVGLIGRDKLGTRRVWTHAVLRWLLDQGIIENDRYLRATVRLVGWQYIFTGVNPAVMRMAGNQSVWRTDRWPLKQAINYMSLGVVRSDDAALLGARLVADGYLDVVLPDLRRVLLQAVAESLAGREDADRTIRLFAYALPRVFGLNAAGQADALLTLDAWRREYRRRVVQAPG